MNRRSFQKLAEARLLDSKALLKAKRYDAAYLCSRIRDRVRAEGLHRQADTVIRFSAAIEGRQHGVLQCLSRYW
jgi:hypothetical protein